MSLSCCLLSLSLRSPGSHLGGASVSSLVRLAFLLYSLLGNHLRGDRDRLLGQHVDDAPRSEGLGFSPACVLDDDGPLLCCRLLLLRLSLLLGLTDGSDDGGSPTWSGLVT